MAELHRVLLGIADSFIGDDEDASVGWSTNKFGGVPNWMLECLPKCSPKCGSCSNALYLVAQVYCPLEGNEHQRTLHVFGCLEKECREKQESWLALRSQFVEEKPQKRQQTTKADAELVQDSWCDYADDWGSGNEGEMDEVDLSFEKMTMEESSGLHKMAQNDGNSEQTGKDLLARLTADQMPTFQSFYVNVLEESGLSVCDSFEYEMGLLKDYEAREGPLHDGNTPSKVNEKYEKTAIADGDRAFHKFKKRIQHCKEQCLRYEWNGSPLLISEIVKPTQATDNIPPCSNCGCDRVFEMQLMPALASLLQAKKSATSDKVTSQGACLCKDYTRMDFGTILIYTCSKSCSKTENGENIPNNEFVITQSSPDSEMLDNILK